MQSSQGFTVANVLKRHGLAPAPERGKKMLWKDFIRSHLETLAAVDFFTVEVWTASGLMTYYVLVFMRIDPRKICIAGSTLSPDCDWMKSSSNQKSSICQMVRRTRPMRQSDRTSTPFPLRKLPF